MIIINWNKKPNRLHNKSNAGENCRKLSYQTKCPRDSPSTMDNEMSMTYIGGATNPDHLVALQLIHICRREFSLQQQRKGWVHNCFGFVYLVNQRQRQAEHSHHRVQYS